ncbi:MAG: dipeptide ABC transporter ATP-binding protein [Lentisphaeria bacterium]|nr:dipeptide ABC transporter ATP-binding protein [Lentisphaeria bacterium]
MLLSVDNLQVGFHLPDGGRVTAVDGISFELEAGKTLALVGESGCGKSVTAFSIMRLLPENAFHPGGSIRFDGRDLLSLSERAMRGVRGDDIAMIFQEPMTSLNPLMRIGRQIREPLVSHRGMTAAEADNEVMSLLKKVGIPDPESRLKDFPHQLSGGMRQRVMIAMALACQPKLLIADEPTTALDVTIQAQMLGLIKDLQRETTMSVLFITHDLGVVNQIADDVRVMYAGQFMETGRREQVYSRMAHPYTRGLFASLPSTSTRGHRLKAIPGRVPSLTELPTGCRFRDRCREVTAVCSTPPPTVSLEEGHTAVCHWLTPDMRNDRDEDVWRRAETLPPPTEKDAPADWLTVTGLKTHFPVKRGVFMRTVAHVRAVDDVSFAIPRGTTLALVGESGCGKTTVGTSLLRLLSEARGRVVVNGENVMAWDKRMLRANRRRLQIVFQDPFSSLSPRMTVGQIVGEGLRVHFPDLSREERRERIVTGLKETGLSAEAMDRYPHEFSGGQRQRISIARALVLEPEFIVLDEPTSALDVSVQAQILNLLQDLRRRRDLTFLFITHDLSVVRHFADFVAVMYLGKIVEYAACEAMFARPLHPYTRSLLQAVPSPFERRALIRLSGEVPSPLNPPSGCHFHPRCPVCQQADARSELREKCPRSFPDLRPDDRGGKTACHALEQTSHAKNG